MKMLLEKVFLGHIPIQLYQSWWWHVLFPIIFQKKRVLFPISELSFYTATPQRRGLFINIYYHCFWYYNIVHCTLPDGWSGSTNQYGFQVRDQQGLLGPYCVTKRIPGYKENCLKFQLYFFFFFLVWCDVFSKWKMEKHDLMFLDREDLDFL